MKNRQLVVATRNRVSSMLPFAALLGLALVKTAAATSLQLRIEDPSSVNESNRTAVLTWPAEAALTYRVQSATNAADPAAWKTEDAVAKSSGGPIRWMAPESLRS